MRKFHKGELIVFLVILSSSTIPSALTRSTIVCQIFVVRFFSVVVKNPKYKRISCMKKCIVITLLVCCKFLTHHKTATAARQATMAIANTR